MHVLPRIWPRASAALTAVLLLVGTVNATPAHTPDAATLTRWQHEAAAVTITRDDWGIPHVHGKTNADAVFGMIYAQAEDDFNRVETNYINALGRLSETEGKSAIWRDLRMKLFIDPAVIKAKYAQSPAWLQKLMKAWADGLNYFLYTHPDVRPRVIHQFEPWMALAFSEGSIGGDVTQVSIRQLAAFYDAGHAVAMAQPEPPSWVEPMGSNGIAIAPKLTTDGHAMLLINPHVTFYFRTELQMTSDAGLNAYGAATWGQFFLYQGFNRHLGWMHTTSGADAVDEFAETIVHQDGKPYFRYGHKLLPVTTRQITVQYKANDGHMASRTFTGYYTIHGPIVREADGKWIATSLMHRPIKALEQSWLRMTAKDLATYRQINQLQANSSNNTLYADDQGNIAMFMPQFIPKRDNRFDYLKPVDGSDPATTWQGPTPLKDMPNTVNPPNGWVMNTNNWPWTAAGKYSPKQADFPRYMDRFGANPRGVHATRMLTGASGFTIPKLISDAFDSRLPAFARLIPILVADYDALPASDPERAKLAGPIELLRHWDDRWSATSMPTTLAVFWGDTLWDIVARKARAANQSIYDYMATDAGSKARLDALATAAARLQHDFGHWGVAWGEVNRFQRLDDAIEPHFDDSKPSRPVPFVSSRWGSLASFGAHPWPGTKRWYGNSGNSFVAAIEFGDPRVHARAVRVGGQSGHTDSAHFTDQAQRYIDGNLRTVYFWPDQLKGHVEATYHPGQHDTPRAASGQQ